MNTQPQQASSHKPLLASDPAVISWALIVALAMLSFLVHVLNEQVQRGESWRQEFRLAGSLSPMAVKQPHPLRLAEAGANVQRGAAR